MSTIYSKVMNNCCSVGGSATETFRIDQITIFIPEEIYETTSMKKILSKPGTYFYDYRYLGSFIGNEEVENTKMFVKTVYAVNRSWDTFGYYKTKKQAKKILKKIRKGLAKNTNIKI